MTRAHSTPGTPLSKERTHVVYDANTGVILHVHHTVEFEGGEPETESPEQKAVRWTGSKPNVRVTEVPSSEPTAGRRVDPSTGKLTGTSIPTPRAHAEPGARGGSKP